MSRTRLPAPYPEWKDTGNICMHAQRRAGARRREPMRSRNVLMDTRNQMANHGGMCTKRFQTNKGGIFCSTCHVGDARELACDPSKR